MSRAEHPNSTPLENLAPGAAGWTIPLFPAIIARRSLYALTDTPNPDVPHVSESRIKEIVSLILTHAPSPFNVQSARCVILLGDNHKKMWDEADRLAKGSVPQQVYEGFLKPRIQGFKGALGSVLFFEDEAALTAMKEKNPMVAQMMPEWSEHSSGMHQFLLWTSLTLEGFGCNLQHYNYNPAFNTWVQKTFDLPEAWRLRSQLNFGWPVAEKSEDVEGQVKVPARERGKTYEEIEGVRLRVFA